MYVLRWELERRQANLLPPPEGVLMEVLPGQLLLRARCSTQLRRLRGPTGWTQGIFLPTRSINAVVNKRRYRRAYILRGVPHQSSSRIAKSLRPGWVRYLTSSITISVTFDSMGMKETEGNLYWRINFGFMGFAIHPVFIFIEAEVVTGHCENCRGTITETTNNSYSKSFNVVNRTINVL